MAIRLSYLIAGSFLLLSCEIVSGNHHQKSDAPHRCQAEGDSSEECLEYNSQPLQTSILDIFGNNDKNKEQQDPSNVNVRFFLRKNALTYSDQDSFVEVFADNATSVREANPFPPSNNTQWKILIPGFPIIGKSPFPKNVIDEYVKHMAQNPNEHYYNILVVDWNPAACISNINFGKNKTYTEVVGLKVAEMVLLLQNEGFANLRTDVHVIGFSLGAHVAGELTREIFRRFHKTNLIYRLTVLDPASKEFWAEKKWNGIFGDNKPTPLPFRRATAIRRSFVYFLDVYHTSKDFGIQRHLGDIDFYPNGGEKQEGCQVRNGILGLFAETKLNDFEQLCSHVYATELFAKSINPESENSLMTACTGCDYYDIWEENKCMCEDTPIVGEFVDQLTYEGYPSASGEGFFKPGDLSKFGKRFMTRLEAMGEPKNNRKRWTQLCQ